MKEFAYIQVIDGMIYAPDIFGTQEGAEAKMVVDFFDHADLGGLSRRCYTEDGYGIDSEAAHEMYQKYMSLKLNDGVASIQLGHLPIAHAINEEGCRWKGIIYSIEV